MKLSTDSDAFVFRSAHYVDDDFQRRLDQILLDVKSLEDLINDIQSPKKTSENEVNEKIKVLWINALIMKEQTTYFYCSAPQQTKCWKKKMRKSRSFSNAFQHSEWIMALINN